MLLSDKCDFYRFRTTINVLGDALGAGIVYHLSKKEIDDKDKADAVSELELGGLDQEQGSSSSSDDVSIRRLYEEQELRRSNANSEDGSIRRLFNKPQSKEE